MRSEMLRMGLPSDITSRGASGVALRSLTNSPVYLRLCDGRFFGERVRIGCEYDVLVRDGSLTSPKMFSHGMS